MATLSTAVRRVAARAVSSMLPGRYRALPQELAALQTELRDMTDRMETLDSQFSQTRKAVEVAYQEMLAALAEHSRQRGEDRAELTALVARTRMVTPTDPELTAAASKPNRSPDLDSLYAGFEERFRGSRDNVLGKLTEYLPIVRQVCDGTAPLVDIGPGRCEWLELLRDSDIAAYGVDTNKRFVELGATMGLDVRLADAVEHLRGLKDQSLAGITAFQVAEHLPIHVLVDLVDHGIRVLKPGGVLILETPNPLNLRVGASEFWIDPTHRHPLHPQFLEYLLVNRGYTGVHVRMTHPPEEQAVDLSGIPDNATELRQLGERLNGVLSGPCDYAAIGYRASTTS